MIDSALHYVDASLIVPDIYGSFHIFQRFALITYFLLWSRWRLHIKSHPYLYFVLDPSFLQELYIVFWRFSTWKGEGSISHLENIIMNPCFLLYFLCSIIQKSCMCHLDAHHTEVTYGSSGESLHVVNLVLRKCTCWRFKREKLPCVHAIAAAEYNTVCRIFLCSPYYNSEYLVSAYAESIMPADEAQPVPEIVANQPCLPPYIRQQPGRPNKNRMKSALEVAL